MPKNKNHIEVLARKLIPNVVLEKPQSYIMADFIMELPPVQGYNAILVVCNRMAKIAHFVFTIEKTLVERVAMKRCKRELHTGTNKNTWYQLPIAC